MCFSNQDTLTIKDTWTDYIRHFPLLWLFPCLLETVDRHCVGRVMAVPAFCHLTYGRDYGQNVGTQFSKGRTEHSRMDASPFARQLGLWASQPGILPVRGSRWWLSSNLSLTFFLRPCLVLEKWVFLFFFLSFFCASVSRSFQKLDLGQPSLQGDASLGFAVFLTEPALFTLVNPYFLTLLATSDRYTE